jgi:hypothetical protein
VASGPLTRGFGILRSAPWLPLLGTSAAAAVLLAVAVLAHRTGLATVATFLGLSACGGAAAYVLDEEATPVLDVTPTSRGRRVLWRLLLVALPATVALSGLLALNRLDAPTHWLRLVPLAAGSLAIGVALAAALRRVGTSTPGDLAGVVAVAAVVLIVAVDPLRRWANAAPLGDTPHPERSTLLWSGVVAACGAVTATCSRDPARRGRRGFSIHRDPNEVRQHGSEV